MKGGVTRPTEYRVGDEVYRIGDKVPMPERKLDVRPAHWVDGPRNSPRGVFTNGNRG